MSAISNCCDRCGPEVIVCGIAGVVALSMITMLVVGILGATGVINMSATAADWLISVPVVLILGLILGGIKAACK